MEEIKNFRQHQTKKGGSEIKSPEGLAYIASRNDTTLHMASFYIILLKI